MKKLVAILILFLGVQSVTFADDIADVRKFFDDYVKAANSYSSSIPSFYTTDAKIIRVVHKPNGKKVAVPFPMSEYTNQMKKSAGLAKLVGYKNTYKNVTVTRTGSDYKVSAMRYPRNDKVGMPFYFIVTKTPTGYKAKVESMDTTVQDFLKYAK